MTRTLDQNPRVNYQDVVEVQPHRFVTEASSLGFRPGQWPEVIETPMGNGQPLRRTGHDDARDGEVTCVWYRQDLGCIFLGVLND